MALQIRRGTDAERQTVIFNEGEVIYTTDLKEIWVGDGSTTGGVKVSDTNQQNDSDQTTDATPTVLATIAIPSGEERVIQVRVRGHEDATDDTYWRNMRFCVKNVGGTASLVGGVASDTGHDTGAAGWDISAGVSGGNATVTVTGEAAHTIDWTAITEKF